MMIKPWLIAGYPTWMAQKLSSCASNSSPKDGKLNTATMKIQTRKMRIFNDSERCKCVRLVRDESICVLLNMNYIVEAASSALDSSVAPTSTAGALGACCAANSVSNAITCDVAAATDSRSMSAKNSSSLPT